MASDASQGNGGQMLSASTRKRLQQCFVHAGKQAAQDNYDYATELFTQCVLGDLNNIVYWQSFFGNLRKKYNNNKKGAKLASFRSKREWASIKKAQMQKDHKAVFKHGLEVLKLNPWDNTTLMAMSASGEDLGLDEVPLVFLRLALDATPQDPDVNRACAKALRTRKQFDQAIACWHRVLQANPDDDEASQEIADLAVEKTIDHGGYEGAESSRQVAVGDQGPQSARAELTQEQQIERKIEKDPSNTELYYEMAEGCFRNEEYKKAEEILKRAYKACGETPEIQERIFDAQLRRLRFDIREKEAAYRKSPSEEAKLQWKKARKRYDLKSLEAAEFRCNRYPNNLVYRFQLGRAYYVAGKHNEAIKELQLAKNESTHAGECLLLLGQSFQKIKQYRLAASHYEQALAKISESDEELQKTALYAAGRLALGMKELDKAENHLTALAGIDFSYQDVSALLDKIAKVRKNK